MKPPLRCLFMLTTLPFLLAANAPAEPADLAPTLRTLAQKYKFPGAVAAILHGDQIVALGSTGIRKLGQPAPFLPTDKIHLGSDTKAMTALLIAQLIDRRQFTIDTTMRELFPDLLPTMDPTMARVTIRNLLTHTAGLPHDLNWWALDLTRQSLQAQRRLAVQQALAAKPASPLGTYSYSNVGYVLLGAIIEAKTRQPWEEVIRQEIFRPLKMSSAAFGPPGTPDKLDQPWGHALYSGTLKAVQIDNAPVMGPAGRVNCTISDWAAFIAESMRCVQRRPTLVSATTFDQVIVRFPKQDYAAGWIVTQRPWAGGLALTHSGSNTTWYCDVWIAPKKNFAVMIAINSGIEGMDKAADDGASMLIDFNATLPPPPPVPAPAPN